MGNTIKANLTAVFDDIRIEPWDVSNSVANLGPNAAKLTWDNALRCVINVDAWLLSDKAEAVQIMRDWARETGAWDRDAIARWSDEECLALFVQNVASELREHLGSDDHELAECARVYEETNWELESGSPVGYYYLDADGDLCVDWYGGI